ncbi:MAG: lytic transglycosylase domain-containing protein [Bryobacteraceae bacterium]
MPRLARVACMVRHYDVRVLGLAFWLASSAAAGEFALLASGSWVYAERHESAGDMVRLYRGGGFIEIPATLVAGFEQAAEGPQTPASSSAAGPAPAPPPEELIRQTASRYGGEDFAALVASVARVESGYRPDAVSAKGARGLMQLMPQTARQLAADPDDPQQNAEAGARYLRELLLKYMDHPHQLRLALAAYNAGPGAVDRYGGVPPYSETVRYVERVIEEFRRKRVSSASSNAR